MTTPAGLDTGTSHSDAHGHRPQKAPPDIATAHEGPALRPPLPGDRP